MDIVNLQSGECNFPQIHYFPEDDHYLVLNTSTLSLCEVDQDTANLLSRLNMGGQDAMDDNDRELYSELQSAGIFQNLPNPKWGTNPPVTTLYLNVATTCNLRCPYCFASFGSYGHASSLMSAEVGEMAIDLLMCESQKVSKVSVIFSGGEPLINSDVVVHLIAYGRQRSNRLGKNIHFVVVTNATILTPQLVKIFAQEKVSLSISLDGPPEIHDRLRHTAQGEPTYDRVLTNIHMLQAGGVSSSGIHATMVSLTPPPVAVLDHLAGLGLGVIQLEFADPTQENLQPWNTTDLNEIKTSQEALVNYFLEHLRHNQPVLFKNILHPLNRLYRRIRVISHCDAGVSLLSVTPDGTIFPCPRFTENPAFALGSVYEGLDRLLMKGFIQSTVDGQEPCQSCWARYLCGGGCRYNNCLVNGDINSPVPFNCIVTRQWLELIVYLFTRIKREMPEIVEKIELGDRLALYT